MAPRPIRQQQIPPASWPERNKASHSERIRIDLDADSPSDRLLVVELSLDAALSSGLQARSFEDHKDHTGRGRRAEGSSLQAPRLSSIARPRLWSWPECKFEMGEASPAADIAATPGESACVSQMQLQIDSRPSSPSVRRCQCAKPSQDLQRCPGCLLFGSRRPKRLFAPSNPAPPSFSHGLL